MTFAKISQAAYYVPSQVVTNDDLSKIMDTSDEWITSRTGIRERRISQSEDTSDLASQVAKELLKKASLKAKEIDFIIVATITPDAMMPSTAACVQAKIGAVNAFAFDLTAACSGFIFALSAAEKMIKSGQYQKGLVIGAEVLSKIIDWSDRTTAVLFGDGAGGVLLEADSSEYFLFESIHSDGSRGESLTSGEHAVSSPFSQVDKKDNCFLKMDGRAIFDFAIRDVSKSISTLIRKSDMPVEAIDYFLLHQANIRILDKMAKKIGADREKFPANMMKYGNTSAASIPILLAECVENGTIELNGSHTVLLSGFGGGLTWGSLIVKI
ncbi:beta-ketoacyl-ACP synthase III [Streptococcus mutans]|jgi:3-oxoacyl-[acyl-carrier-protein] synthase 3|uniref:beta-ketoacyl-ACP synthase III n=1 Tax=Streptococcus mutans TaxID=1309 RepID=UPI0002B5F1E9|nr:beta-ketoacyl-ACP synthase III [Streptococcus mutans]EMC04376.1 3-oxoacyl-(acyl carrier protein) synthase III [Streptococcus mutans NFSM1]MCB4948966.1 ketoacyl-ACP synthase III [Streptococcus mutans]MCB4960291.1 ketoacyl-ACP synthase III [Streptococcus mutans]MCB5000055.1 ketoacyl-ACP synthase III [Streptococcus mutans]MCB5077799.1 ketoacyl-ACP synthase III [Streptococcus mutans]